MFLAAFSKSGTDFAYSFRMSTKTKKKGNHFMKNNNLGQPNKPYLKLTLDAIFKAFFKDKSVSTPFLEHFLPLPKERKIVSMEFLDPNMTPENSYLKAPILDLRVRLDNKEHINIEMQALFMKNFKERVLYYLSTLYTEQLKRGKKYQKLYPAYSLVFTKFTVFPEFEEYCSRFFLQSDTKEKVIFSKHLGIILVELSKFKASSPQSLIDKKDEVYLFLCKLRNYFTLRRYSVIL